MSTVLIVEDDRHIREALATRLVAVGHEVVMAPDGAVGIQEAVCARPDLILMDICLPGGDGIATAERIQEMGGDTPTPIIFLTASRQEWLDERSKSVGGVAFFHKPYDPEALLKAVETALV